MLIQQICTDAYSCVCQCANNRNPVLGVVILAVHLKLSKTKMNKLGQLYVKVANYGQVYIISVPQNLMKCSRGSKNCKWASRI